ncbi:MAG: glycosyltransferase family 39 protein [Candidatus Binatia bacterium]
MLTDSVLARYKLQWKYIVLIVLVVLGLALRLHEIHYNLDGDEVLSVKRANKQFAEVISGSLQNIAHPPLHLVLLHLWVKVFGPSEASARSLSVLFSAVFLWMSYRLFCRFVSPWLALGVLSIVAVSPWFVYYGQQARPYALVALLSTANVLAFVRVLEQPAERGRMVAWTVSSTLLLYAQYLGVLLIAFQIGFAVFYLQSERRRLLACGSLAVALIVPWAGAAMGGKILSTTDPLLRYMSWIGPPAPMDLVRFYVSVFGEAPGMQTRWLFVILVVLGAAYVRHATVSRNLPAHNLFFFLLAFGLPAVVTSCRYWGQSPSLRLDK